MMKLALGLMLPCVVCVSVVLGWCGVALASNLPAIEVAHMGEIEEWAYRNAAVKNPLGCGEVCGRLWTSEHRPLPETAATQEMWDALGNLNTARTHLWGTMGEFREALKGKWPIGPTPFEVGWQIDGVEATRWMRVYGPIAPLQLPPSCTSWYIFLKLPGEELQSTFYEHAYSPENDWYLQVCGNASEIVGQVTNAENPKNPGANCGNNGFAVSGWKKQEWWWNKCNEGLNEGVEVLANTTAQAYYKQFHFSRPEDWTGQTVSGEFAHNIASGTASDPGVTFVREALEKTLEESPPLQAWIQWVLEGEVGIDPLAMSPEEQYGAGNPAAPGEGKCLTGHPVNCATGDQVETQTDLSVGGRGPGLELTRAYNSQYAATQSVPGPFGFGWTGPYSAHVELTEESKRAVVYQDNGSIVAFIRSGEQWVAVNPLTQAKLASEETGYRYTLPDQTVEHFDVNGLLTSVADRNGNSLTLSRNAEGRLESVSDPAGRKLTFAYNTENLIESATDPMGHLVKYAYEAGNLVSVTLPGETAPDWQFKYDGLHRMTEMTDGRGGKVITEYDSANRATAQTDAAERKTTFVYEPAQTKITNTATGAVTDELFSANHELVAITHGYGTANATTSEYTYDKNGNLASVSDGNKHATTYEYNSAGDRIKTVTPEGHETKWGYDSTHDVTSVTRPNGETTTITRDEHGNATLISRPAPGATIQETHFEYNTNGQVTSMTDPLGRKSTYEYDPHGDRTSETDPEGEKTTRGYNEDSVETSRVSPRGNVTGGEPAKYTTTIERDARGRQVKITDPLGHITRYTFDANSNIVTEVDPNGHETKTIYDPDNEPTKVTYANGAITETGYDGAGQVIGQTDGNKHETKYVRNVLEQVTETTDPLLHKTTKTYDLAGNLATVTDPATRVTTYTYNKDNQPVKTTYSDGLTPTVEYEYDADGNRTSMTDGSGKTTYTYDQLDRLTKVVDGHLSTVAYEYDLADEQTRITYPNGKTVERSYDKAARLASVKDWLGNTISFGYDPNSNQTTTTFPTGTGETDHYAYNESDRQTEAKMNKGTETQASLAYTRDNNGQLTRTVAKGLPGTETTEYAYDPNERLTKAASTVYEYDPANNPTKIGTTINTFNAADQLTEGTGAKYAYDESGERTKTIPTTGTATTYGYDQAGDLTTVTKPKEGKTAEIKDTYAYNGDRLRINQTIAGKTSYLAWDHTTSIPLLLNDATNSYIYGPNGVPVEQITSTEKAQYLHHDQADSTRLITSSTGTVEGAYTYTPYGTTEGHTGTAATPLGYDGQYTSSDTGLTYLRARTYDPNTAQFMSVDPLTKFTRAPYTYTGDNPLTFGDPTGLFPWEAIAEGVGVGASCLLGPDVCAAVGLIVIDAHVGAADFKSIQTGCSPWPEIVPTLVGGAVGSLSFGGGLVARDVWEASRTAFRVGVGVGVASGSVASTAAAQNTSVSCGC